jgi:hypothetical protein
MIVTGALEEIRDDGFTVYVQFAAPMYLVKRDIHEFAVSIDDGRRISSAQRRKVHALIHDLTEYVSAPPNPARRREEQAMLRELQLLYLIDRSNSEAVRYQLTQRFCALSDIDVFSLSSVDMTTAREFIDWLVELCVRWAVPCQDTLLNRCEDVSRYLYACVANRRCCVCGGNADIHHVDHVGMGRDRERIHNLGMRVQPLCRVHHDEAHRLGQAKFDERYHLESIKLDAHLCDALRLNQ